jgi:hypothetical protein
VKAGSPRAIPPHMPLSGNEISSRSFSNTGLTWSREQ